MRARSGAGGWRADYSDFMGDLPRSIHLASTEPRRFDLRLQLSQVDVNVGLDPATFRVTVPAGTQPITLEELRAVGLRAR